MKQTSSAASTQNSTQQWFLALMIISLATMATHLYLTIQHYELKLGLASSPAICNISATFNCDSVAASRYSQVLGIPVALLGLVTQVIFFILLVAARFQLSSSADAIRRLLFWFSIFTFLVSIVMGSISSLALGIYCLFCMAAYVLSLAQLMAAWRIQEQSPLPHFLSDIGHLLSQARWVVILLFLIPILSWLMNSITLDSAGFGKMKMLIQNSLADWQSGPAQNFNPDRGLIYQASSSEPVMTIVEFADFLCPHCKVAATPLDAFVHSHPDVKLVFKVFPLDGTCNKAFERKGPGMTCKLAAATFCAEQIAQKGWASHKWIFEHQEELFRATDFKLTLERLGQTLGLDTGALQTCMDAEATLELLQTMAQEGTAANIRGTPTVFVNGKLLPGGNFVPVLEAVYQSLQK